MEHSVLKIWMLLIQLHFFLLAPVLFASHNHALSALQREETEAQQGR